MCTLDALVRAVPAHQVAGRTGVEVLGFVRPPGEGGAGPAVTLHPCAGPGDPQALDAWLAGGAPPPFARAALRDHLLAVRPHGQFLSTDEVALSRTDRDGDRWSIVVEITRSEGGDLVPAPRDLFVVLRIEPGRRPPRILEIRFAGRSRDQEGNESPVAEPMAPPVVIEFPG